MLIRLILLKGISFYQDDENYNFKVFRMDFYFFIEE